jgi:hypothetical protein
MENYLIKNITAVNEGRSFLTDVLIRNGRIEIQKLLRDSPSLSGEVSQMLADEYSGARADAIDETELSEKTFPSHCPFTMEQVLDERFWPDDGN